MNPFVLGACTLVALLFSGLFGTVEAAVSSISRARVEQIYKDNETSASRVLLKVLDQRAEHINLLVLGRTMLDATAAVFAAMFALAFMPNQKWALVAAILGVTLISFTIIGCFRAL